MAFVGAPGGVLSRSSDFCGGAVSRTRSAPTASVGLWRMAGLTDKERISFAKIGSGSKWRENVFVGGFPGGEEAYLKWIDDGMKDDVPDLPDYLQAKTPYKESVDSRKKVGVLETLDKFEFFGGLFSNKPDEVTASAETASAETASAETASAGTASAEASSSKTFSAKTSSAESKGEGIAAVERAVVDTDAPPSESLYEQWFPKATRNLAPIISMVYEKDIFKDRVGMRMGEIVGNATDLYYPAEMKNKAPVITIDYNGNLATASVKVAMEEIEPLPAISPPVSKGETVSKLVKGAGGGLKLEFEVEGEGPVNVYSDPRAIEKFNAMGKPKSGA